MSTKSKCKFNLKVTGPHPFFPTETISHFYLKLNNFHFYISLTLSSTAVPAVSCIDLHPSHRIRGVYQPFLPLKCVQFEPYDSSRGYILNQILNGTILSIKPFSHLLLDFVLFPSFFLGYSTSNHNACRMTNARYC